MNQRIGGEGPRPARLMIIGEMPGIDEGRAGRPFAGKAGRELRRFLNGYDLPAADDVFLTNYSKTVAPTVKEMVVTDQDRDWLYSEIAAVQPAIICTLGANITEYLIGNGHSLEAMHGIPHTLSTVHRERLHGNPVIFPSYNPSAMLHSPKLQSVFAYDMRRLGLALKRKLPAAARDEKPGHYTVYPTLDGKPIWTSIPPIMGLDSEGWVHKPWCIGASGAPYTGEVIKFGTHENWVNSVKYARPRLVVHSALHDLPVFRVFGLDIVGWGLRLDDTMVMAYLLGIEPQGLKALSYRHAGMEMHEYSDITADAAALKAFAWLMARHDELPEKANKITKTVCMKDGGHVAMGADGKLVYYDREPLIGDDVDLAKARTLIGRMLEKGCTPDLAKKWADGRAREILVDELCYLHPTDCDPEEPTLDEIDPRVAIDYAGRDPDGTLRVFNALDPQIDAMGLREVYDVDMSIIPMIDRMQQIGIAADVPHFRALGEFFKMEEGLNLDAIEAMVGRRLNPNSGDQVAELLYDELQLQDQLLNLKLKKTKEGRFSTNDKTLDAIKTLHPIVGLIQEGREIRKLRSTYCETIPDLVAADGRLHPNYRITRTETGRLSASDPNVLALPKHSERGKLIRYGFLAGEGHELGEWDLSQIEMCMFAHDSQDPVLCAAIIAGLDLHYDTAARVILGLSIPDGVKKDWYAARVTKAQRFAAKAVNFGILMGITAFGLLDQLHKNGQLRWTIDMCEELLATWHRIYKVASDYIKAKHAEARQHGFVRDCWGRLRWLEGIHSHDDYIRAEAERMAQATPTQSGAQGIMKRIMRAAWPLLVEMRKQVWVEPLLQIHDALVLEYDVAAAEMIDQMMMYVMTNTVELRVPVRAAKATGFRLSDLGE